MSLIPYLETVKGNAYLKLSLVAEDPSVLETTPFPFLVIHDTDPLARLVEGQFLTDAGTVLKTVFVLVQKDRYSLTEDALWPVSNVDIEGAWQNGFSFYAGAGSEQHPVVLTAQIDEGSRLAPLAPLFFCKTRQRFFPPLCPKCAQPLQLCRDDAALIHTGLQPYSSSLKRYLWCVSCGVQNVSDFYVYERDHLDPPGVKDRFALIRELGLSASRPDAVDLLPCGACVAKQECFGSSGLAPSRIVPFSFYPFYMLIFEAMSLNALDFLALLSGAAVKEVEGALTARGESGRVARLKSLEQGGSLETPFLYRNDEKFFLEVLYLKLSFLGDLARSLPSTSLLQHPDLRLSLDRTWVRLADQSGLLPTFWNFRVEPMDISRPLAEAQPSTPALAKPGVYFLGLAWLLALLVNKRQDMSRIVRAIKQSLGSAPGSRDASVETILAQASDPVNIFWDPDGKCVSPGWVNLWKKALELGWSLLMAGIHDDRAWSRQAFAQQLEDVRKEVMGALSEQVSRARPEPRPADQAPPPDDKAIHDVLLQIMSTWRAQATKQVRTAVETRKEKKEEMLETVILSVGAPKKEFPGASSPEKDEPKASLPAGAKKAGEVMPETVIITPAQAGMQAPPGAGSKEAGMKEPDKNKKKIKKPDEEFLAETVILTAQGKDK